LRTLTTLSALLLATTLSQAQTTRYRVEYLDGGMGSSSVATAQNAQGQIVGQIDKDGASWPARLDGARSSILLERGKPPVAHPGSARFIGSDGAIAGMVWIGSPGVPQPFVATGKTYRVLPTPIDTSGDAVGINASGLVVGNVMENINYPRAAWHDGMQWIDLPRPAGSTSSQVDALNDAGQAAGWVLAAPFGRQAARWQDGQVTVMQGLGSESQAHAINAAGTMAGEVTPPVGFPFTHAAIFRNGQAKDLDGREKGISIASGLNSQEQVVGAVIRQGLFHGFITTAGQGLQVLDDLLVSSQRGQWHIQSADAISDSGQIIGRGLKQGDTSYYRALRLTPVTRP
jgi:uncharacterized membrane protein